MHHFLFFISWTENPPSILGYTVTHSNNVQMEKRIYEVPYTLSSHHGPENCIIMLKLYNNATYHKRKLYNNIMYHNNIFTLVIKINSYLVFLSQSTLIQPFNLVKTTTKFIGG